MCLEVKIIAIPEASSQEFILPEKLSDTSSLAMEYGGNEDELRTVLAMKV